MSRVQFAPRESFRVTVIALRSDMIAAPPRIPGTIGPLDFAHVSLRGRRSPTPISQRDLLGRWGVLRAHRGGQQEQIRLRIRIDPTEVGAGGAAASRIRSRIPATSEALVAADGSSHPSKAGPFGLISLIPRLI